MYSGSSIDTPLIPLAVLVSFDEFGYHLFDQVEKKLVRSHDVVFFEDQTTEDLEKTKKVDSQSSEILVDVDPNDQYAVDASVQDDVVGQQPTIIEAPESSLRRSTREKIPSSRYSPNEYVILTDGGEPESLDEAM
ncbi:hypothetical protein KY289_024177 [Solanum tuberosum]|nr:hypothetical protein KY289_024177 [Solanum tuberosum]